MSPNPDFKGMPFFDVSYLGNDRISSLDRLDHGLHAQTNGNDMWP